VFGTIKAKSDAAFRALIARIISFYSNELFNRHWGEQIRFHPDDSVSISMVCQGLNRPQIEAIWKPFIEWVNNSPRDFVFQRALTIIEAPARHFWDIDYLRKAIPTAIVPDGRPEASPRNYVWAGDQGQAGQVLHGYKSAWLPASLLKSDQQGRLAEALFACSRHWGVSLHFNKGLAGAPAEELAAARDTAMNPLVLEAFALAIIATGESTVFPGIPGHEPNVSAAREHARKIAEAMNELLQVVEQAGSYVSESDFFERSWQQSFWGANYPRLAAVKKTYDPDGLFFVHHGVGSEEWSPDGFTRLT
jgi:hypothetical protein